MPHNPSSPTYTKYANLPDIDTCAPDVYEYEAPIRASDRGRSGRSGRSGGQRSRNHTPHADHDVPSDSSSDHSSRSAHRKHPGGGTAASASNHDIDSSSLRRSDAAAKFSAATQLHAAQADFSGRLTATTSPNGRNTRPRDAGFETTTYAIDQAASNADETVVDRLRRLKFEASRLEEELAASGVDSNAAAVASQSSQGAQNVDSADVLAQLKILQHQLASLPPPSTAATLAAGARSRTCSLGPADAPAAAPTAASAAIASGTHPPEMAQLEARLSQLESTLGVQEALLDESKPVSRPVLATLSRLEHQLSLLSQPRHLDAISRRVKVLVTEMDRVHDVRRKLTTPQPSATAATHVADAASATSNAAPMLTHAQLTQLQQLFDVSSRLEPLLPVLPAVVNRLHTLADVHSSAAHFGSVLDELEHGREATQHQHHHLDELLQTMQANMDENRSKVETNLELLQARIDHVAARFEKLSH